MAAPTAQAILAGDGSSFAAMITSMLSPKNEQRQAAENLFTAVKANADLTATNLLQLLRHSPDVESRAFCAVMLRKVLTKDEPSLWPQCSPNVQNLIRTELLNCVRSEKEHTIIKKVCDTISELASGTYEELGWPELLPFIFQCVQGNDPRLQESSLLIFAQLSHHIIGTLRQYMGTLHEILSRTLTSSNRDVALASMRATAAFVQELKEPSERDRFQSTIPTQLAVIWNTLQAGDEGAAQEALELFIEVAESHPRFLKRNLTDIATAMLQIAEAEQLEDSTRQLAAEFLVTLCEAREKAPGMMRKLPQLVARLFECLVTFLLDVEDDPLWHQADSDKYESEGEGDRYGFGQECLDRIALALGGNTLVPLASTLLPVLLQDADWRKRHAALITLSQIAEGCVKAFTTHVSGLTDLCLLGLRDPHAKVKWAACQAVGQLCTDLGPDIQEAEHARLLPGLLSVMDDFSQPRVQAHAAAAIVNFAENCEEDLMPPYLDVLITKLLSLLQNGQKLVQEGALTAMASVADCSKDKFIKYYSQVMPLLRHILSNANDKSHALLRAKALECISLVGMAVGREQFREDAHCVMQFMQGLQAQPSDADDPTGGYMLQAGARICKSLGEEFMPYLGIVMPPLLTSAQLKPDIKMTDAESTDEEENDEDVETIYLGDRKISVRTSVMEEKATACNMLCCYADELKEGFYPYVEQVTGIMLPLLKFYFHEEVRAAAAACIPDLLRSAYLAAQKGMQGADASYVQRMVEFIWGPVMEALGKEPDTEVMSSLLDGVEEIIGLLDPGLLPVEKLGVTFERLKQLLEESYKRRAERQKRRQDEDFDEEEAEALEEENEDEEDLLDQVSSVLTAILKKYGDLCMPLVDSLMPSLAPLLDPQRTPEERRVAICILDDILEYSPAGSAKYLAHAIPKLLEGCKDKDANVRQCSVYGLGIVAQLHQEAFRPSLSSALMHILGIITAPDAREEDNEMATENAVCALGKVLEYHGALIQGSAAAQSWNLWVSSLPLVEDRVEAKHAHAQLVRHIEASDARVLGENNENLGKIVAVLAKCLSKGSGGKDSLVDVATWHKVVMLLQQMNSSLPPPVMQSFLSQLKPKEKTRLEAALSGAVS